MNDSQKTALQADIYLLLFLGLLTLTAILMTASGHLLLNTIYIGLTVASILITYFWGIIPGLIENGLFIFAQILVMIYLNTTQGPHIPLALTFWLIVPLGLSFFVYQMTVKQRQLQRQNQQLRSSLIEQGAFDVQTKLRTMVAMVQDAQVFIETNRRFELPVTVGIIRIRYYGQLKSMMSDQQISVLLELTSNVMTVTTRENDITYYLNEQVPTWGVLLFADEVGAQIALDRIRDAFNQKLKASAELGSLNISLISGAAQWDSSEMHGPYDLIDSAIKETEYDVGESN